MATEASLFPMDISTMLNQDQSLSGNLQDDPFLQELIKNEGVSGKVLAIVVSREMN